jgi:iron complex outermembrane receptor protein
MSAEFVGNPNLDPERSVQGDAWLDGRFERFAVHVGLFGRKIYDYITIQPTDLPKRLPLSPDIVYQYVNGKATFRGFEASATAALSEVLTLDGSVSSLHGHDDELNEPAIGVSPLRTSFGLRYEEVAGRFYVEGVLNLVAEQDEVSTSRGEIPTDSYQTGDVRGGFGLTNGVTLRGGVLNLWNEQYSDHLNAKNPFTGVPVPEPGRVFFLDVAWSF